MDLNEIITSLPNGREWQGGKGKEKTQIIDMSKKTPKIKGFRPTVEGEEETGVGGFNPRRKKRDLPWLKVITNDCETNFGGVNNVKYLCIKKKDR